MGVERADGKQLEQCPSIALGTQEMSPLTMASAYATFASRGMYCTPVAIESISQTPTAGEVAAGPEVDVLARDVARRPRTRSTPCSRAWSRTAPARQAGLTDGRDNAGKTGTTDERYDAWFVGYTPNTVRRGLGRRPPCRT